MVLGMIRLSLCDRGLTGNADNVKKRFDPIDNVGKYPGTEAQRSEFESLRLKTMTARKQRN
jgi:hypothetical protein